MGLTVANMTDQVHYLLGQSSNDSATNYVTDTQIEAWINEGVRLMCYRGRLLDTTFTSTVTGGSVTYATLTTSGATYDIVEVLNVMVTSSGVSLNQIDMKSAGKTYVSSTANDTMWWYTFGGSVFLIPAASALGLTFHCHVCPTATLTSASDMDTLGFDSQHWYRPISFAAFRGLMTYNRVNDAMLQLQAFTSGLVVDYNQLAEELGRGAIK